jgi:hypothetical protein
MEEIVEEISQPPLSVGGSLKIQIESLVEKGDPPVVILSPKDKIALLELKEDEMLKDILAPIEVREDETTEEPVVIGLYHLTRGFLQGYYKGFPDYIVKEVSKNIGLPIVVSINDLRLLFLVEALISWRASEMTKERILVPRPNLGLKL